MTRREAWLSAGAVFLVALVIRAWVAAQLTFPLPEDVAYYVGVARNLLDGHGLTADAIWSFQTPPLTFPRPAFEVWLPLPTFLMAIPMAVFGSTFAAAQVYSVLVGSFVPVFAWRLGADVAAARSMPVGRARTLALGAGLTSAVYLPLVLGSAEPDSTMAFAVLVLLAVLVMNRLLVASSGRLLVALGIVLGFAALTRNEAIWLGLAWAYVAWRRPGIGTEARFADRLRVWLPVVVPPAIVAAVVFAPWAIRDWIEFGSPLPGQALTNALSLDGRDIFAWQVQPTLARYLDAGLGTLLQLRWTGIVHDLVSVLLLLGVPLSVVGLIGMPGVARPPRASHAAPSTTPESNPIEVVNPLRPLLVFSILTFLVASLVFPVSTTWGTFLHAAGAIHVLLVISALLVLDRLIGWVGHRRQWTNPVAWLGPAFAIAGCLLFTALVLPSEGTTARQTADRYAAIAYALSPAGAAASGDPTIDLSADPNPVITDFPIWFSETTGHHAIALPNEAPDSVLDLARTFGAHVLVVSADNTGVWPAAILNGAQDSSCFVPIDLPNDPAHPGALDDVLAFHIRCP